jgi:hypothetical protein
MWCTVGTIVGQKTPMACSTLGKVGGCRYLKDNAEGRTRTGTGVTTQRILSPLCLPFHHPGRTRFARHLPVPRTRARTWPASKSALLTAGLYTTPKSACKDTPKAQRSTIWGKLERGQKRLRLQSSTTNTPHRNRHGARLLTDTALTFSRKRHHSR